MAKKREPRKPNRALTDQLNVRIPNELFRRVSSVAGAKGETLAKFVAEILDERTKDHVEDVRRIADRETSPKKWQ
jgi:predicted HicB family RNase H-like nuclease